jgi:hypothetical protein
LVFAAVGVMHVGNPKRLPFSGKFPFTFAVKYHRSRRSTPAFHVKAACGNVQAQHRRSRSFPLAIQAKRILHCH